MAPTTLTIIDNKVIAKVGPRTEIPPSAETRRRVEVHICPFQSFCRSLEDKIKEIKLESSGESILSFGKRKY